MANKDPTFRNFTPEQAAAYATGRKYAYPEPIYNAILDFHEGKRETMLDVGTGPGKAVWDMIKYFDYAIGCDPSASMVEQAKKDAEKYGAAGKGAFTVATAEDCASALSVADKANVDVVTSATAAHWFDMPKFYESAAKALRPGGTLAMWIPSSLYCHPTTPHHEEVQRILSDLEDKYLDAYMNEGNRIARNAYETLPLPWADPNTEQLFDKSSFTRNEWNRGGVPSSPPLPDGTPGPFLFSHTVSMKEAELAMSSSSPLIRWREANPDKAGTEEDPLKITIRRVKDLLGEDARLTACPMCSLLLMRRT